MTQAPLRVERRLQTSIKAVVAISALAAFAPEIDAFSMPPIAAGVARTARPTGPVARARGVTSAPGLVMQARRPEDAAVSTLLRSGRGQTAVQSLPSPESDGSHMTDEEKSHAPDIWVTRLTVLFVAFLYGSNFGSVKLLGESIDVSLAAGLRFCLAAVALSPLLKDMRKEVILPGLEIGFWVTLGYVVQAVSLETVEASKAAFLCALIVVVCPVLDALNGSKVKKMQWASAALAVFGAGLLELGGDVRPGMGDLLALIQPIGFGVALWKCEKVQSKYPDQGGAITSIQLICTALASILWVLWDYQGLPSAEVVEAAFAQPEVSIAVVWTGLITTALTVFLQTTSVSKLSSSEATVLISTEPIWGAAFANLVLGEVLGPNAFVGGALIVLACLSSVINPNKVGGPLKILAEKLKKGKDKAGATVLKATAATITALPGGAEIWHQIEEFFQTSNS